MYANVLLWAGLLLLLTTSSATNTSQTSVKKRIELQIIDPKGGLPPSTILGLPVAASAFPDDTKTQDDANRRGPAVDPLPFVTIEAAAARVTAAVVSSQVGASDGVNRAQGNRLGAVVSSADARLEMPGPFRFRTSIILATPATAIPEVVQPTANARVADPVTSAIEEHITAAPPPASTDASISLISDAVQSNSSPSQEFRAPQESSRETVTHTVVQTQEAARSTVTAILRGGVDNDNEDAHRGAIVDMPPLPAESSILTPDDNDKQPPLEIEVVPAPDNEKESESSNAWIAAAVLCPIVGVSIMAIIAFNLYSKRKSAAGAPSIHSFDIQQHRVTRAAEWLQARWTPSSTRRSSQESNPFDDRHGVPETSDASVTSRRSARSFFSFYQSDNSRASHLETPQVSPNSLDAAPEKNMMVTRSISDLRKAHEAELGMRSG